MLDDFSVITTLDGQPFVIFDSWTDVSAAQDHINEVLSETVWSKYRPIYLACAQLSRYKRDPFSDLRLGALKLDLYDDTWRTEYNPEKLSAWYLLRERNLATPPLSNPGYSVPEGLWTIDKYMSEFMDADEYYCWGFSDEYTTCGECYNAIRISPDCYQWQPDYVVSDWAGYVCKECVQKDQESYIEQFIENPTDRMVPPFFELEQMNFSSIPEIYQNGWHAHMTDTPQGVLQYWKDQFKQKGVDPDNLEFVFSGSVSQFYVDFQLWVRPGQEYDQAMLSAISDITNKREYA